MGRAWIETGLNVAFWLLSGWLIVSTYSIEVHEIELVNGKEYVHIERSSPMMLALIKVIAIGVFLFYSNYINVLMLRGEHNRIWVLLRSVGIFAIAYLLHFIIELICVPELMAPLPMGLSGGLLFFFFAVSTAYGVGKVWISAEQQRQQLTLEKKQSELSLLRNQLQPHFLFNVLNSLMSMIEQDQNPELTQSIDRLSVLLRYVVDETSAGPVPVNREISFLENYAELQLLRFGEGEVDFSMKVRGEYLDQPIEPGLFLPFVENAFRYGSEPENKSRIQVNIDVSDPDYIQFSIKNNIQPQLQSGQPGTGISSVKKRLNLVYPKRFNLEIEQNDEFSVELKINTNASDHRR